ncbi:hypothetical protein [Shewanella sp. MEBiC00475]|uniref:hypothetical protein n=1 Tax=Shewanella sp. MEBiC00475 TaxID=2575361 RepID=UPI0010BF83DF|nr:hypothetical protein [Shewanella sp. MEBiC00475]
MNGLTNYLKKFNVGPKRLLICFILAIPMSYVITVVFYSLQTECVDDLTDFDLKIDVDAMTQAEVEGLSMWFDEELNQWCMFKQQY